ncbi:N-acetyltransferase [Sphingomonas segetis]|nr:N-acetyltransferase [Sphingomonas segetis]
MATRKPTSPFFAAYIKRHAEEQDLLDPAWQRGIS